MKVQQNITVFAGDTQSRIQAENENAQKRESEKCGTEKGSSRIIYAGNLTENLTLRDRIQKKKEEAQERALKIISDAWDGDKQIEESIGESSEHIEEYQSEYQQARGKAKEIAEERERLREPKERYLTIALTKGRLARKTLELLEKARVAEKHPWAGTELTDAERERLAVIGEKGLTQYQAQQLELSDMEWRYRESAHRAEAGIQGENASIRGIREERRKHHPIADAKRNAEKVLEAARDQIIGMVVEESREHLDEEQEKREEVSEAIQEKREEQEEILEKREEREAEFEELIEELPVEEALDLENVQDEIRQEIENMMSRMGLTAEELKGAKVDTSV